MLLNRGEAGSLADDDGFGMPLRNFEPSNDANACRHLPRQPLGTSLTLPLSLPVLQDNKVTKRRVLMLDSLWILEQNQSGS